VQFTGIKRLERLLLHAWVLERRGKVLSALSGCPAQMQEGAPAAAGAPENELSEDTS
jgi:hypothetical protein